MKILVLLSLISLTVSIPLIENRDEDATAEMIKEVFKNVTVTVESTVEVNHTTSIESSDTTKHESNHTIKMESSMENSEENSAIHMAVLEDADSASANAPDVSVLDISSTAGMVSLNDSVVNR